MADLMAEVNEAMRQERLEKFWKENGKTLILFVIATVIMTGVISAYRSWDARVKTAQTDTVLSLMEDPTFPDNLNDEKIDLRPGLRGVLLINGAQANLDKKKNDEALALYAKVADDKSIPGDIRDLAILMQARLTPGAAKNEALKKQLESVASDDGSPWQYPALLDAAALAAESGDYKTARAHLASVMDEKNMPETLYQKAQALDHLYALREAKTDTNTKAGS